MLSAADGLMRLSGDSLVSTLTSSLSVSSYLFQECFYIIAVLIESILRGFFNGQFHDFSVLLRFVLKVQRSAKISL